ncbi:MAG: hypothetical protein V3U58_05870, partial [Thermodesulfobacteriota bacterium]
VILIYFNSIRGTDANTNTALMTIPIRQDMFDIHILFLSYGYFMKSGQPSMLSNSYATNSA